MRSLGGGLSFLICCSLAFVTSAMKPAPNIIFVLADDLGFNDVGYHGSYIQTPNLDALAASGVKLENYYVQPICSPTRGQLLSGRYQIHTGMQHGVIRAEQPEALPTDSPTIADKLKENGYATHMVGKWHVGFYKKEFLPWNRGFDQFYGHLTGSTNYYEHTRPFMARKPRYLDLRANEEPVYNETGHYATHLFTEKAIDAVRNHDQTKPFFLYLAHQAPHSPLEVPASYEEPYAFINNTDRRTYAGMVACLDEGIGNLTQALKDAGMWDNTVFIFSTDNGGSVLHGGNNFPLRGVKGSSFEGGSRAVGFVAGPKIKSPGTVNKELIHVTDWFPTLVRLAGGDMKGTKKLDGFNQWQTITNGAPSKRNVILHRIDPLTSKRGKPLYSNTFDTSVRASIRAGDMKLITGSPGNVQMSGWVPPPESETIQYTSADNEPRQKNVWLFNITADPTEHLDLSDEKPEIVLDLLKQLEEFDKTSVPARYPDKDPKADPGPLGGVWGPWVFDDDDLTVG